MTNLGFHMARARHDPSLCLRPERPGRRTLVADLLYLVVTVVVFVATLFLVKAVDRL